jgi:hypothetical protein
MNTKTTGVARLLLAGVLPEQPLLTGQIASSALMLRVLRKASAQAIGLYFAQLAPDNQAGIMLPYLRMRKLWIVELPHHYGPIRRVLILPILVSQRSV